MKKFLTAFAIVLAILLSLFLYQVYKPENPLTKDLASPSQQTRDAAAKILRATAKPPSKLKWLFFTWHLKKGESQTNLFALLRSYNLSTQPEGGFSSIGAYWEYRLDDYWLLGCDFGDNYGWFLGDWKLIPRWHDFYIRPATNFNGTWITYYANGQKSSEANYTNGILFGEFTDFYPDGLKSSVWYYENGERNGICMQYFPTGRVEFQCLYSNNAVIGNRVWYYTNGVTEIVEHYENGKWNGPKTIYFPSGKIKYQCLYSNYEKIGIEVNYNEDGTTNSIVDHSHQ